MLAGLVTYRAIYGKNPVVNAFTVPAEVPTLQSALTENISELVLDIESRLEFYCNETLSNDSEDAINNQIIIYPNPAGDFISVQHSVPGSQSFSYQLTDLDGKIMLSGDSTFGGRIDVQNLKEGMYILKVELDGDNYITKKFVKKL